MTSGSNGQDDGHKTPRHPRWTRQETLVLIEAKKIVEERGWRGRKSSSVLGTENVEPKWDAVSSYCRRNGVERGGVQCRKRWSNLLSDFKKIKTWDSTAEDGGGGGCFWAMRSDSRRERRLPGFFDREVYEVLDGKDFTTSTPEYQLALVTVSVDEDNGDGMDDAQYDEDEMDGGENRDGLFSDVEKDAQEDTWRSLGTTDDKKEGIPSPVPISEMKYRACHPAYTNQEKKRQHGSFQEGVKRRRRQSSSDCRNTNVDDSFIKALERNTDLLKAQLEERKMNRRLDREEEKEQHDSLMTALGKIADALEKIANKL